MSSYPFSSFVKQFRQQPEFYTGIEETPYENILLRSYDKSQTDIHALGKVLSDQLTDNSLIHRLLVKLTNTDTPATGRLSAFVYDIINELATLAAEEPYTAQYYNLLIEVLTAYLELLHEFQLNGSQTLSDKLTEYFTMEATAGNNMDVYSEEVRNLQNTIQNFLYQFGEFYEYFHMLLQKESEGNENQKGVMVTTQVSCYLETLIDSTEKLLINTESTLDMLCTWETAALNREARELFN
jgi:hypothetical protein